MAVLLGLLVALSYGAGDFFGGLASRRLSPGVVAQLSQIVGLVGLAAAVTLLPDQHPVGVDLARGAASGAAGLVGLVGLVLLYRGFSRGAMSIVAPVTAVGAGVLPLAWGLLQGERPGAVSLVGVVLALVAVALVSTPSTSGAQPATGRARETALALAAGAAFGVVFILLSDTSGASGLFPVLAARVASVTIVTGVLLARGTRPAVPAIGARATIAAAGILDVTANALFVLAAREGLLSLVAPLSSLYPATTLVLAAVVLHERVERRQQVGLGAALVGVVLIAL